MFSYGEAINKAIIAAMSKNSAIHILGQGAPDPTSAAGPLGGIREQFPDKIHDVPMSEEAVAGICVGMAMNGLRPLNFSIRMDFLLLAMNQICNMAAKISYMYGGRIKAPVVFRGMIGKSWGQGSTHSQGLYPMFCIPGLRVIAPVIPYDAQGVYYKTLMDGAEPTLIMEHRHLYYQRGEISNSEDLINYRMPHARVLKQGKDITLVGISMMAVECMRAAQILKSSGIEAEVIAPLILNPLGTPIPMEIASSVMRTKHLIVVDNTWVRGGYGADVVSSLHCANVSFKAKLMGFEETVCPTSPTLEKLFYPSREQIAQEALNLITGSDGLLATVKTEIEEIEFKGPF